jgi:RimJ/RimL family protein N-acetyltransferase
MWVEPVTLTGKHIRLEPLREAHTDDLTAVGLEPSLWRYIPQAAIESAEQMAGWVRQQVAKNVSGVERVFAVIHLESGKAIGSTRYMDIRPEHRGLEIGGTWYGVAYQRTAVNTEAKYLLLRHAFETLGCIRVQLKTDLRNERSQTAIARLGAVREGVLRNHVIMSDGYRRASVFFSILDDEWPEVKRRLEIWLAR